MLPTASAASTALITAKTATLLRIFVPFLPSVRYKSASLIGSRTCGTDTENRRRSIAMLPAGAPALNRDEALELPEEFKPRCSSCGDSGH